MSNIAKGFEGRRQALFIELLGRARGSAGEVRSQVYVTLNAGSVTQSQFQQLVDLAEKCSRQISRFMTYLSTCPDTHRVRKEHGGYDFKGSQRWNVEKFEG